MISGVNHLGIAVRDLDAGIALYRTMLQREPFYRKVIADQRVEVASFDVGGVLIELTAPTSDDSPVAKFIEKRGEGIHHLAFTSSDVKQELERLSGEGLQLIDQAPKPGAHGMQIAFVHPKSTLGTLTELCAPLGEPSAG
jgi:methylmalonyl-CoA/ethylmalonyl-CoA epimerase